MCRDGNKIIVELRSGPANLAELLAPGGKSPRADWTICFEWLLLHIDTLGGDASGDLAVGSPGRNLRVCTFDALGECRYSWDMHLAYTT